jgi:hypothetical protein
LRCSRDPTRDLAEPEPDQALSVRKLPAQQE